MWVAMGARDLISLGGWPRASPASSSFERVGGTASYSRLGLEIGRQAEVFPGSRFF
jgi:hypothetical protein